MADLSTKDIEALMRWCDWGTRVDGRDYCRLRPLVIRVHSSRFDDIEHPSKPDCQG
jgi:hypothetical protein